MARDVGIDEAHHVDDPDAGPREERDSADRHHRDRRPGRRARAKREPGRTKHSRDAVDAAGGRPRVCVRAAQPADPEEDEDGGERGRERGLRPEHRLGSDGDQEREERNHRDDEAMEREHVSAVVVDSGNGIIDEGRRIVVRRLFIWKEGSGNTHLPQIGFGRKRRRVGML